MPAYEAGRTLRRLKGIPFLQGGVDVKQEHINNNKFDGSLQVADVIDDLVSNAINDLRLPK